MFRVRLGRSSQMCCVVRRPPGACGRRHSRSWEHLRAEPVTLAVHAAGSSLSELVRAQAHDGQCCVSRGCAAAVVGDAMAVVHSFGVATGEYLAVHMTPPVTTTLHSRSPPGPSKLFALTIQSFSAFNGARGMRATQGTGRFPLCFLRRIHHVDASCTASLCAHGCANRVF